MHTDHKYKHLLVIVTGLLLVNFTVKSNYLLFAAILIALAGLLSTRAATIINKGWAKLTEGMGWINSKVLLSIVYFFILTPIALIWKLFKRNPMHLQDKNATSLFIIRNKVYRRDDLENPW